MVVVRPVRVSTVTVPPFVAPEMLTGPLAVASWSLPVLPRSLLSWPLPAEPLDDPEPPQALRASTPTAEMAINGDLNRIAHPFRGCCISPGEPITGEFWGRRRLGSSRPGGSARGPTR